MTAQTLQLTDISGIKAEMARTRPATSTLNLIVWLRDESTGEWVRERLARIIEKHPSRAFVLDAAPKRSGVTVHADAQSATVDLAVSGIMPGLVFDLLTNLLTTDVPTVLWWNGELSGATLFTYLVDIVDSVIIDSSLESVDSVTMLDLARFAGKSRVAIRDLAWMRLRPWQDLIANFFDGPALAEEPFCINQLRIVSGSDAEAMYLAGWLGSRLGWKAVRRDRFSDRNGNPVDFVYERAGDPRRVYRVELRSTTTTYHGDLDDPQVVRMWSEGEHAGPEKLIPLQAIDNTSLVERAVLEGGTDEIFETALRLVGTLLV